MENVNTDVVAIEPGTETEVVFEAEPEGWLGIRDAAAAAGYQDQYVRQLVLKDGHSRYPVYDNTIDKIVGLVYVNDLLSNMPEPGEKFVIENYLRDPYFVPENKIIGELLQEFKSKRLHIAIVADEYGGVAGLVTLEDIIEEIFGEIQDEHDAEESEVYKLYIFRIFHEKI